MREINDFHHKYPKIITDWGCVFLFCLEAWFHFGFVYTFTLNTGNTVNYCTVYLVLPANYKSVVQGKV